MENIMGGKHDYIQCTLQSVQCSKKHLVHTHVVIIIIMKYGGKWCGSAEFLPGQFIKIWYLCENGMKGKPTSTVVLRPDKFILFTHQVYHAAVLFVWLFLTDHVPAPCTLPSTPPVYSIIIDELIVKTTHLIGMLTWMSTHARDT